ncbi:MAG: hypothetical protein FVQ80_18705 [Planctomycetes bacterium]|nr:hypothetical protein [Planctomycetota bacterium]
MADFFRQSPWSGQETRTAAMQFVINYLLLMAEEEGYDPVITARKDKDTGKLQGVDWVFDHSASGKGQTQYCKAAECM